MQIDLEPTLILDTQYKEPKMFVVVGAGGTGGYLVPNLARQISITNKLRRMENLQEHRLMIIDADTVGLSNLNRQNFIEKDINRNKAEVLATRYGTAFELIIDYVDQYITSTQMLVDIVTAYKGAVHDFIPVIIDCVDNNKTRVFIHEAVNLLHATFDGVFSLSSGNEFLHGQVVCGFNAHYLNEPYPDADTAPKFADFFRTPTAPEMFPEILEGNDKLPTELSCDEAAVSHPQNIMVNIAAANHLYNFANILMTAKRDNVQLPGLKHFAVTFDTSTGSVRTFRNKKSTIGTYLDASNA